MKTMTLEIVKKNRLYFACKVEGKWDARLKITEESKDLEPGVHTLLVDDLSVKSKWGYDRIYTMRAAAASSIVTLQHDTYNYHFVKDCKNLGGKWDASASAWVFNGSLSAEVEDLDALYNSDTVTVTLTTKRKMYAGDTFTFCGYTLIDRYDRLRSGAILISGNTTWEGRSNLAVPTGTVLRIDVPRALLDKCRAGEEKDFEIV